MHGPYRTVYLIRHGEPEFGGSGRVCLGRRDLPLSPAGREQAGLLRGRFSAIPLSGVYHSPLSRCRETAELLAGGRPVFPVRGMEEVDMGEWDGRTFGDIRRLYPEVYRRRGLDPANVAPPGGESLAEAGGRFAAALLTLLRRTGGDIAVVAHAGVNRMLLGGLLRLDARQSLELPQPYGCVSRLQWDGRELTVQEIGAPPRPGGDRETGDSAHRRHNCDRV